MPREGSLIRYMYVLRWAHIHIKVAISYFGD